MEIKNAEWRYIALNVMGIEQMIYTLKPDVVPPFQAICPAGKKPQATHVLIQSTAL